MPRIHVTVTVAQAHRLAMLAELLDTTPAQAAALMLQRGLDSLHVWLREDGRYYSMPAPQDRPETIQETWRRMDALKRHIPQTEASKGG